MMPMPMPMPPWTRADPGGAVVPTPAAIAAAGVGIARSLVLAVGVRIELRAVAGVVDHFLRPGRACQRGGGKCGGQTCKFHGALLVVLDAEPGNAACVPSIGTRRLRM